MQISKGPLFLPLILTLIFVISSFIPVIQILILTLSGGLISSFERMTGDTNIGEIFFSNLVVNFLPAFVLLIIYWNATHKVIRIFSATISMTFLTAFLYFLTDGIEEDGEPYFLSFLIIAIISGFILTSVSLLKYRLKNEVLLKKASS